MEPLDKNFNFDQIQKLYSDALTNSREMFPEKLKYEQAEALFYILSGNDVIVILPTSFGKSLIFISAGLIIAQVNKFLFCNQVC